MMTDEEWDAKVRAVVELAHELQVEAKASPRRALVIWIATADPSNVEASYQGTCYAAAPLAVGVRTLTLFAESIGATVAEYPVAPGTLGKPGGGLVS